MRTLWIMMIVGIAVFFLGSIPLRSQQPPPVDVKVVKYDDLANLIQANKGKVILLDFWATTCLPCKESFFHNVEMYNALRDKGLVVISVSTNDVSGEDGAKTKARVLDFLQKQGATFTNVILDEPQNVLEDKMRVTSLPCIYVFNREGQWTQFIGKQLEPEPDKRHHEVAKYVQHYLSQPAK